jgi:RimJ/RimL family protein N-acetyltransferase
MNRISAKIISFNVNSIHLFEKLGFIKEGILRKASFRNGIFYDKYLYSILYEEFLEKFSSDDSTQIYKS